MQRVASIRGFKIGFRGLGMKTSYSSESFLYYLLSQLMDGGSYLDYVPAMAHQVCAVLSTSYQELFGG